MTVKFQSGWKSLNANLLLSSEPKRFKCALNTRCSLSDFHNLTCVATELHTPHTSPKTIYYRSYKKFKVAEDDIAFKLAILKKSLHLNDNTCFCSIIQSSKLFLGSLLSKNNFFVNFEQKILHPPGWPIVGVAYRRSGPSAAKMQLKRRIRHCPVACG